MKKRFSVAAVALAAVAAVASLGAQAPSAPAQAGAAPARPRGATAPPEQASVKPVNFLPNPYETVRNFGPLPNGRKWGSVSAVDVDPDGRSIWARTMRHQLLRRFERRPDHQVRFEWQHPQDVRCGPILWPHGMDVDKQGNVRVVDARVLDGRRIEEVS